MSLTTTYAGYETFFRNLAVTEGADGQALAQSICRYVFGDAYQLPYTNPPMPEEGARIKAALHEIQTEGVLKLYPNPAQTGFWLENRDSGEESVMLVISDALGRSVSKCEVSLKAKQFISLPETRGIYFITCSSPDQTIIHRQIIIKD